MANNLFISYDLMAPGQRYADVVAQIKTLGPSTWAKVHLSLFYVNSTHTAATAAAHVWSKMDANDKLIVVDATNNDAVSYNLPDEVIRMIKNQWVI